ncbi:bifunctional diaminohydroxyphosphoribosylaminopyrimidine deaminase/5-amino-6-(5-phosphoribosylamino)uracil reductase RibD [Sulfurospirillum sp. T05]|uniref:Bifunctional diaminohydroxyphosphoribosylaminopyrimidine deaminase/5-amino-6-(5-phosphoribosylamino)uracil reductase RibD n=1 Tax=Sulfurospirillum tamanense TaxID=2813362 RepID=A0ABS2WPA8_9BACT|nr:bifunctional diaminohydroxyphosphoribosylaminopyrimidine deaminase/5-amino-6-(5-phosphoribosylamino)uracil reductase RibD [Sulfurospirillum tamanensis]MBN2963456.1 bifunctional diaminohydroxyphosphoribosylaminopyrimidine deaminase/5-amino-6-(5-phosphoribosylamino)uracil reductase RibD [Sulfurospirillum tamanensis]
MPDEFYMRLALEAAWEFQGRTYPNPAVGCVICSQHGEILAIEAHQKAGEAHAEVRAVKTALGRLNPSLIFPQDPTALHAFLLANHQNLLKDASIYVTLEPCNHYGTTPPCALLLRALHVRRVCIGMKDESPKASGGMARLVKAGIGVKQGVLEKECALLLAPFLAWQKGHFSFFKLAMSSNGVIDGGIVTSEASRKRVHELRQHLSLLAIGGNTVRTDRPTLDARLCAGKAPDVLIYSREAQFDQSIPLFSVPERKVTIASSWEPLLCSPFVMIEGGEGTLRALPEQTQWLLVFRSAHFKTGQCPCITARFKRVWHQPCGEDMMEWYIRE